MRDKQLIISLDRLEYFGNVNVSTYDAPLVVVEVANNLLNVFFDEFLSIREIVCRMNAVVYQQPSFVHQIAEFRIQQLPHRVILQRDFKHCSLVIFRFVFMVQVLFHFCLSFWVAKLEFKQVFPHARIIVKYFGIFVDPIIDFLRYNKHFSL